MHLVVHLCTCSKNHDPSHPLQIFYPSFLYFYRYCPCLKVWIWTYLVLCCIYTLLFQFNFQKLILAQIVHKKVCPDPNHMQKCTIENHQIWLCRRGAAFLLPFHLFWLNMLLDLSDSNVIDKPGVRVAKTPVVWKG